MTRILFTLLITCLFSGFVNAQETSEFSVLEPTQDSTLSLDLEAEETLSLEPAQETLSLEPAQETLTLDPALSTLDLQQSDPLVEAPSIDPASVDSSSLLTNELNAIAPTAQAPVASASDCNCDQTPFGNVANVSYVAPAAPLPVVARPIYPAYTVPNLNQGPVQVQRFNQVQRVPSFNQGPSFNQAQSFSFNQVQSFRQVQRFNQGPAPFTSQVRANASPASPPTCVNNYSYAIPNRALRRGVNVLRRIAR